MTNDEELRLVALDRAILVSRDKGDSDGQTVIRRAVGFYKFLTNKLDSNS